MTIIGDRAEVAERLRGIAPLHIVHNEQVQQSVIVHVHPYRSLGPQRPILWVVGVSQSCLLRYVGEGPVAVVVVQRIAIDAGDEDVRAPIVVVVAHCDANVVTGPGQSRRLRHVGESPVAVIPEKTVPILRIVLLQRCDVRAVREKNVRMPVAVVIENRDAARHAFRRISARRLIVLKTKRNLLQFETDGTRSRGSVDQQKSGSREAQN